MQAKPGGSELLARVERSLPGIYLAFGLLLTSLLCILTAPFFGPDEPAQACRAISLGHGQLLAYMGPSGEGTEQIREAGADIDTGALLAMDGMDDIRMAWEKHTADFHDRPYGPVDDARQRRLDAITWTRQGRFEPFGNTAVYPPMLYLPAIAGWRTGEAANLTIFQSLRLARLFCAFTAIVLGWLALRLCACSRWLLLPFLLLPSTLFLNATCSQDATMLGVAALIAAILSRPLAGRREFTQMELAATATLLALCSTARPPYLMMVLVLFLPGVEMQRDVLPPQTWRRWIGPATSFSAVLAVCALWRHLVTPFGLEQSDIADMDQQTIFLRTHPLAAGWAAGKGTLIALVDFLRRGVYVVGWNDLLPHHGVAPIVVACVALMVLLAPAGPIRTWRGRALLAASVAATLLAISLAEYIIWTPPGLHTVYGVQPRYWMPLVPLAAMLLQPTLRGTWVTKTRTWLLPGAAALLAITAATLPWMVAHAFYRDSLAHVLQLNLR